MAVEHKNAKKLLPEHREHLEKIAGHDRETVMWEIMERHMAAVHHFGATASHKIGDCDVCYLHGELCEIYASLLEDDANR